MELYPGVKISIGPPIENGFYYDFDFPDGVSLSDADFEAHRGEDARAHRRRRAVHARGRAGRAGARALPRRGPGLQGRAHRGPRPRCRPRASVETVSLYTNGPFTDLCRGPHAPSTKRIGAFKLQSVAGAYWRGDAKRQMLTRVYGTAFFKQAELDALPRAARAGAGPRPPQARPRARAVHLLAAVAGRRPSGCRRAPRCSTRSWRSTGACSRSAATSRSRRRCSTSRSCGRPAGTGASTRTTSSSRSTRSASSA